MTGPKDSSLKLVPNESRIIVPVSKKMEEMLGELVTTGLYGTTTADAARRLIERGLEDTLTGEPE